MFQLDEHDAMQQAQDEMQRKLDEHNERLDNQDEELHELADAMIQERARRATWEAARDRREHFRCAFQSLFSLFSLLIMLIMLVEANWHGTVHQPAMKPVQSDPFQPIEPMPMLGERGNNSAAEELLPMKLVQSHSFQPLFLVFAECGLKCRGVSVWWELFQPSRGQKIVDIGFVLHCGQKWPADLDVCRDVSVWWELFQRTRAAKFVDIGFVLPEYIQQTGLVELETDVGQLPFCQGIETSSNDTRVSSTAKLSDDSRITTIDILIGIYKFWLSARCDRNQ